MLRQSMDGELLQKPACKQRALAFGGLSCVQDTRAARRTTFEECCIVWPAVCSSKPTRLISVCNTGTSDKVRMHHAWRRNQGHRPAYKNLRRDFENKSWWLCCSLSVLQGIARPISKLPAARVVNLDVDIRVIKPSINSIRIQE